MFAVDWPCLMTVRNKSPLETYTQGPHQNPSYSLLGPYDIILTRLVSAKKKKQQKKQSHDQSCVSPTVLDICAKHAVAQLDRIYACNST